MIMQYKSLQIKNTFSNHFINATASTIKLMKSYYFIEELLITNNLISNKIICNYRISMIKQKMMKLKKLCLNLRKWNKKMNNIIRN